MKFKLKCNWKTFICIGGLLVVIVMAIIISLTGTTFNDLWNGAPSESKSEESVHIGDNDEGYTKYIPNKTINKSEEL